ncbi:FERM, ARHGEF and pleckstrin domain-containing protein 1-like isoform X2 [Stegodyphus dumicola]|uniref:FERM, ARHGEF and pleckstrin domain-containing protein 1-like isoform X2 n=1 Tax=Stegodyphus dumicola TaxID=202533 RepID=UPI0015AB8FF8|nr:FERM, ARHGEF and pleckstrin domain-containing protein 1-like isoform X2 [Stegodyphus dumicola]
MSSPHHTSSEHSKRQDGKAVPVQKSRKIMNVTVYFLDDSSHVFQLQSKNLGSVLFEKVCKFLNLLEVDYFGLEYEDDKGIKCWLDALKPLCSQISTSFPTMYFCVKFYTPDPVQLEDEFTRYLFSLQVRKDLAAGLLQCNDNTAAVMISYIIQADIGDFNPEKYADSSYLSGYKFIPYQDAELERKIMDNHKKIIGQTPAEADLNLLETARRCELYGIKMTPAKDQEGVPLNLAVAHLGVLVFQNFTKINTFSWAKIRKLSFKRKKFLIKLHPEGYGYYKDTVEFFFEGRNECKNFWKKCIENHTFFRCTDAKQGMRQKPKIFSRGSSFRYSGRTQKQVSEFVRENCFTRQPFKRSTSLRTPSSPSKSAGTPISPQPLLPVTSLSCGSISDISKDRAPSQKTFSTSEPTTPHVAQDLSHTLNGDCSKPLDAQAKGLVSSDFESEQGFQSPDYFTQDTDDNISHDSYHVLEKEAQKTNTDCMLTNLDNISDSKVTESEVVSTMLTNGTKEHIESSEKGVYSDNCEAISFLENNNNNLENSFINNFQNNLQNKEHVTKLTDYKFSSENRQCLEENHVLNGTQFSTSVKVQAFTEQSPDRNRQNSDVFKSILEDSQEITEQNSAANEQHSERNSFGENCSLQNESPQTFGSSTFYVSSPFGVRLGSKKIPSDKIYCLAKELLMTERTYRKDLEIVNVVFREEFSKQMKTSCAAIEQMLSIIDPLYEIHCELLRDLEQRMAFWEGRPMNRLQNGIRGIGDILLNHKEMINLHSTYLKRLPEVLELIFKELSCNQQLSQIYQQFESHKICYLPLTYFFIRPAFRLAYYSMLLKCLLSCYDMHHIDYANCIDVLEALETACANAEDQLPSLVNCTKLMELQRSLIGFPNLLDKNRDFMREGCLLKFSRNGSHQHMFFLFSDILLYTTRVHNGQLRFKVQGQLSTSGLKVEKTEPKFGVSYCLALCNAEKHLVIAASSEREYTKWLGDLQKVVENAKNHQNGIHNSSSQTYKALEEKYESSDDADDYSVQKSEKSITHHINTSIHVCWHRNISISSLDLQLSIKHSLSGYLLRKFKNNSGWQKLWVVLANLCLFLYNTYLDESPLASLPLAGYKILSTSNSDPVVGDTIFKLQFKNHEYFFMVENKYTFESLL